MEKEAGDVPPLGLRPARPFVSVFKWPVIVIFLSAAVFVLYYDCLKVDKERIATCNLSPYHRSENPDKDHTTFYPSWLRDAMFFWGVRACLAVLFGTLLYYSYLKKGLIISFVVLYLGYGLALKLGLEELKYYIEDYECHEHHPNSVSGHTFYAMWMFTLVVYLLTLYKTIFASADRFKALGQHGRWDRAWQFAYVDQIFGALPSVSYYLTQTAKSDYSTPNPGEESDPNFLLAARQQKGNEDGNDDEDRDEAAFRKKALLRKKEEQGWLTRFFVRVDECMVARKEDGSKDVALSVKVVIVLFATLALWGQLVFTYLYGYHSLQQMFFGAALGSLLVSLAILLSELALWTEELLYCHHLDTVIKSKRQK